MDEEFKEVLWWDWGFGFLRNIFCFVNDIIFIENMELNGLTPVWIFFTAIIQYQREWVGTNYNQDLVTSKW